MRPVRLSSLLVAVNVGLLLLAVAGVAAVAVYLLQQSADAQALARVEQAVLIARQQVGSAENEARTSAQLLSERPTLTRLLTNNETAALTAFLRQFQQTSRLDGAAVIRQDAVLAATGSTIAWLDLSRAIGSQNVPVVYHRGDGEALLLAAFAAIPALPDTRVIVAQRLDQEFAQQLSAEIRLPVAILSVDSNGQSPQSVLRRRAISSQTVAAARLYEQNNYVAAMPLLSRTGETVGLLETTLPTAEITKSVEQLVRTLLLLALGVTSLAAVANLLLGRRLGSPLRTLTNAAGRIGHGDLATPVPFVPGAEIGTLAATLEEMRWRLLRLTADLRRQQAEAETIVSGIVEGVFSVDRERRIRYLNPQAATMLGTTTEAAIGKFCGDVLNPQSSNGERPCAAQCPIVHARFRGGVRATEHLLLPNGQRRTVVITSAPPAGDMQVQVLRDETEIEATRRLRDTILANISHEFRTPLSAQLAAIELLLDQLPDLSVEQIGDLVRSQQRGTLRLTQLIDNLLESARLEAGQHGIRRQTVALDEVVEMAVELTHPLLEQRKQTVHIDLPYPLPIIRGDAGRLTQVFVNLIANANKFAPASSTITIGGQLQRSSVTLWVADEGPGLPTMAGDDLFNRFVRAAEHEPEQSGVGLGLWLVKSIVERHNGAVEARSTAKGTRMCVILPLERVHETADC